MAGDYGKQFEQQLREAFQRDLPGCWTQRFTDSVSLRYSPQGELLDLRTKRRLTKVHAKTPPDLLVVDGASAVLIEAKAVKLTHSDRNGWAGRIALNAVADHQLEHLLTFDALGPRRAGLVAVLFYNALAGGQRIYRAWFVPASWWSVAQEEFGRASVTMAMLEESEECHEVAWVPGVGWQVGAFRRPGELVG